MTETPSAYDPAPDRRSLQESLPRSLEIRPRSGGRLAIGLESAGVLDIRVEFPQGLAQMYLTETHARHLHLWLTAAVLALTTGRTAPVDLEIHGWQYGTLGARTADDRPGITVDVQDALTPTSAAVHLSADEAAGLHQQLTAVLLGSGLL